MCTHTPTNGMSRYTPLTACWVGGDTSGIACGWMRYLVNAVTAVAARSGNKSTTVTFSTGLPPRPEPDRETPGP